MVTSISGPSHEAQYSTTYCMSTSHAIQKSDTSSSYPAHKYCNDAGPPLLDTHGRGITLTLAAPNDFFFLFTFLLYNFVFSPASILTPSSNYILL